MANVLADIVDIGGECFNITGTMPNGTNQNGKNDTRTYDLFCKSKKEFTQTFGPILGIDGLRLIRTYLPYQKKQLQGMKERDKEPLKAILIKRMEMLKASNQHSNQSIKNMQFIHYYNNLQTLLKEIDRAEDSPSTVSLSDLEARIRDKFPKERIYYVLMELAYYLLHPDRIQTNADSWTALLDEVEP